jgi:hypothetical protein
MVITLTNVKQTLSNQNINVDDGNALNQQITSIYPDQYSWGYDNTNDILTIYRPDPLLPDSSSIGEVVNIDYSMG